MKPTLNQIKDSPQLLARIYEFFRSQGYFVLPRIFSDGEVADLRVAAEKEYLQRHRNNVSTRKSILEYKLYGALQSIPETLQFATNRILLAWLEIFLGPNIILTLNRHNHVSNKTSESKPDAFHRDHGEWTRGMITAVIYGNGVTAGFGATEIIPGSHQLYSPNKPIGTGYWLSDLSRDMNVLAWVGLPVPVTKGGVLLFDSHVFHKAGEGSSDPKGRFTLTLGYHSVDQLTRDINQKSQILVHGSNIYRGNDM